MVHVLDFAELVLDLLVLELLPFKGVFNLLLAMNQVEVTLFELLKDLI